MELTKITTSDIGNISAEHHGELMSNYFTESVLDVGKGLKAINIGTNESIVFFINKEHQFCAIFAKYGSSSGWKQHILSNNQQKVNAFDIFFYEETNQIRVVYSHTTNRKTTLLVSDKLGLSNAVNLKDFDKKIVWKNQTLSSDLLSRTIDYINIYQDIVLFSSSFGQSDAFYGHFNVGESIQKYVLPEHATNIVQMKPGKAVNREGVFLLYDLRQGRTMLFQPFDNRTPKRYELPDEEKPECFDLIARADGNCDLYLSGKSIVRFLKSGHRNKEEIIKAKENLVYTKIDVAQHQDEVSIWALGSDKSLYLTSNRFYEDKGLNFNLSKWTAPLPLYNRIEEFESIKGKNLINQLFLFGDTGNGEDGLIHFWQDETTTLWEEHSINIESLNKAHEKSTYTMTIDLFCEGRNKNFYGETVKVTAEANVLVYLNHKKVLLGPDTEVDIPLDGNHLHFIYPTDTISSTKIIIKGIYLPDTNAEEAPTRFRSLGFRIDPSNKFRERLKSKIKADTDLRKLKKQDGKPLIKSGASTKDLEAIAKVTENLAKHADKMENPNFQLATEEIGIVLAECNFEGAAYEEPNALLNNYGSNLGHSLGSLWQSIKKGFRSITKIVATAIEGGVKFVITLGSEIFEWVAKKAQEVFTFIEKVWNKIKVWVKDFIQFIGFLFQWKDILDSKKAMKEYLLKLLEVIKNNLGTIEKATTKLVQKGINNIDNIKKQFDVSALDKDEFKNTLENNKKASKKDPRSDWVASKKSHIASGEPNVQHLQAAFSPQLIQQLAGPTEELSSHLQGFYEKVKDDLGQVWNKFKEVMSGDMKIGDFLKYCFLTFAKVGLEMLKKIINLVFKILEMGIAGIKQMLSAEIYVPFFSALYKKISGEDFSILDFVCLLVAVPGTIAYKLGEKVAPFADTSNKDKLLESVDIIFADFLSAE